MKVGMDRVHILHMFHVSRDNILRKKSKELSDRMPRQGFDIVAGRFNHSVGPFLEFGLDIRALHIRSSVRSKMASRESYALPSTRMSMSRLYFKGAFIKTLFMAIRGDSPKSQTRREMR
jgi:hypothetical protein